MKSGAALLLSMSATHCAVPEQRERLVGWRRAGTGASGAAEGVAYLLVISAWWLSGCEKGCVWNLCECGRVWGRCAEE